MQRASLTDGTEAKQFVDAVNGSGGRQHPAPVRGGHSSVTRDGRDWAVRVAQHRVRDRAGSPGMRPAHGVPAEYHQVGARRCPGQHAARVCVHDLPAGLHLRVPVLPARQHGI